MKGGFIKLVPQLVTWDYFPVNLIMDFTGPVSEKTHAILSLRGPGGGLQESEVDFDFLIVSDRGECQLPGTFFGLKKYCSYPKLSWF